MLKVTINSGSLKRYLSKLKATIRKTLIRAAERSSKVLAKDYKSKIKRGLGASNEPLVKVRDSTMRQPIRRGGPDKRIRGNVNASRNPLIATGKTVNSIQAKKGKDQFSYEISSNSSKGDMILTVNAKGKADKVTYAGIRDPLKVTNQQVDIVEKEILKELDRLFK